MTGIRSSFVLLAAFTGLAVGSVQAQASPTSGGSSTAQRIGDQSARQHESAGNVRRRAEDLAGAASKRFSDILSEQEGDAKIHDKGRDAGGKSAQRANDLTLIPVWDWLARASRDYENIIVAKLKNPSGEVKIVTPPRRVLAQAELPTAPEQTPPPPQPGWGSIIENIREWLARANRSYHNEVVKKLMQPRDGEDPWKAVVEAEGEGGPRPTAEAGTSPPEAEAAIDRSPATLPAVEQPATPKEPTPATDLAEAEEETATSDSGPGPEPKLNVEEVKRLAKKAGAEREAERDSKAERLAEEADVKRSAAMEAERKRLTDEVQAKRLAAEAEAERKAARAAEAKRLADKAEAKRSAAMEAERKRLTDDVQAKRLAAEAEAERKAAREAEARGLADEAEAQRLAEETEAKRRAEEEAEAKRLAEDAEVERKAAREAEAKRIAEEAEAKRLADESEAKRLAEKAESKRKVEDAEAEARRTTAKEAEAKRHAQTAEASRVTESTAVPQSGESQAASDTEKTEPPPVPVAKEPANNRPANDRLPAAGAEKSVSTPSRPQVKRKKVRVRKASLRKRRVRKSRYRRRAAGVRSRTRVYAYKSRRKRVRITRHRKDCWGRGAKPIVPRKVHRKRHRARVHGRSGMYVVRRGDTLWGIAKRHYGKGSTYRRIYGANRRRILNPNRIYPRQRLYIPPLRR
jgi:nucleoid-associated protein YgaU